MLQVEFWTYIGPSLPKLSTVFFILLFDQLVRLLRSFQTVGSRDVPPLTEARGGPVCAIIERVRHATCPRFLCDSGPLPFPPNYPSLHPPPHTSPVFHFKPFLWQPLSSFFVPFQGIFSGPLSRYSFIKFLKYGGSVFFWIFVAPFSSL